MVFANLFFLYIFLPVNLILYYATRSYAVRNFVLVAMSFLFYAWGEPVWVLLLLASGFMVWFCSLLVERFAGTRRGKAALIFAVTISLSLLGIFKYSGFLIENINAVLPLSLPVPQFSLPIGISFYTFQMISYIVDVYRGDVKAQPSFLRFIMYVSMYFQLVAGPIVRYSDVAWEIDHRTANANDISHGITRFCIGLLKKVAVANVAGSLLVQYMDGDLTKVTVLGSWFGAVLFMLQIYYDFSGYSDMAIGLGLMFGFHFVENFNYPYIAKTATEFWRRWHISLSSFFRDYVYIPLGGNRHLVYRNMAVVWLLTGLWHGASWNFVLWGAYFFVLLAIERLCVKPLSRVPSVIRHILTLLCIAISWNIFYHTDISRLLESFRILFGFSGTGFSSALTGMTIKNHIPLLILCVIGCTPLPQLIGNGAGALCMEQGSRAVKGKIYVILTFLFDLALLALATISLVGSSYSAFLYFRF